LTRPIHIVGKIKRVSGTNNIQEKKEKYTMTSLNYNKGGELHVPIKYWKTDDITHVGIYQGSRGERPDLDFILKYKQEGKRLRTPSHTHWIVDLLVKAESNKELLLSYVNNLIEIYDNNNPFTSVEERSNYELKYTNIMNLRYNELNTHGYYSIGTLTAFIELFSLCEKQSTGAFMFRGLLTLVKEYCENKKDFYQIVGYSKRV
jgi:hypothetical protein